MKNTQTVHQDYYRLKPLVREVFKKLRKKGFLTRMNFSCCGSCGSYELNWILKEKENKIGYVFWHKQSENNFKNSGSVYLHYNCDEQNIPMIIDELDNNNIPYYWDGNKNTAILIGRTS